MPNLVAERGPGWLILLVFLFIWNAMMFIIMGPVSLVLLALALIREGPSPAGASVKPARSRRGPRSPGLTG